MDQKKAIFSVLLALMLANGAEAAKIAVVVDFPDNSTYTNCFDVADDATGFDVANGMGLSITWGGKHPLYGHAMCKIGGIGNEPATEGCEFGSQSWASWLIKNTSSSWMSIPVGFDGGDDCWNRDALSWDGHYCAANGDVIGYVYGAYDPVTYAAPKMRTDTSFEEICSEGGAPKHATFPKILNITMLPQEPHPEIPTYICLTDNRTGYPVREAVIEVYDGLIAVTSPVLRTETNYTGEASFTINKTGEYTLSISGTAYPNKNLQLNVTATTTTTTTTSTTTTTTSTTTTTLGGPEHFIKGLTTTTATTSTSEPEQTDDGAQTAEQPDTGFWGWLKSLIGL